MLVVTGDSDAAVKVNIFPEANPAPLTVASRLVGVYAVETFPSPSVTPIANPGKMPKPVALVSGDAAVMVVTASETMLALVVAESRSSVR
jgi:hypothetical protein